MLSHKKASLYKEKQMIYIYICIYIYIYIFAKMFHDINSWKFLQVYSFPCVHERSYWCTKYKKWKDCIGATIFISAQTENHAKYLLEYLDSLEHLWWRPSHWSGAALTPLLPSSSTQYACYMVIKIISQCTLCSSTLEDISLVIKGI